MGALVSAIARAAADPTDTSEIAARKRAWVMLLLSAWACGPFGMLNSFMADNKMLLLTGSFLTTSAALIMVYLLVRKRLDNALLVMFLIAGCLSVTLYDLAMMPSGKRGWYFFVVVIDGLLALRAPARLRIVALTWVVSWMTLCAFEMCFRFGLLDLPLLPAYEDRVKSCEEPPCSVGLEGFAPAIMAIMVFIGDYNATAGFCNALELEKEKMAATVAVTRDIAESLAKFDTNAAEESLEAASTGMPVELAGYLRQLVANLRAYRPYLPQGLLESDEYEADASGVNSADEGVGSSAASETEKASSQDCMSLGSSEFSAPNIAEGCLASPTSMSPTHRRFSLFTAQRRIQLRIDKLSLACFSAVITIANSLDTNQYVHLHTEYLGKVMANLKTCRGVLSRFVGESVYASFNAFRRAPTHPSLALTAATRHREMFPVRDYSLSAVVVTGRAFIGTLGTEQAQSPCVVGSLPVLLDEACRAGQALRVPFLCNYGTAWNVSAAFPLRIMLHRIVYPEEEEQRFRLALKVFELRDHQAQHAGLLYTLLEDETENQVTPAQSGGLDEWMYALASEPGKIWEQYNDAGVRYHNQGAEAALRWLREKETPSELVTEFEQAAADAAAVTLSVLVDAPLQGEKANLGMSVRSITSQ